MGTPASAPDKQRRGCEHWFSAFCQTVWHKTLKLALLQFLLMLLCERLGVFALKRWSCAKSVYPVVLSEHFSTHNSWTCRTLALQGLDGIWRIYLLDIGLWKVCLDYTLNKHRYPLAWMLAGIQRLKFMLANSLSSKTRYLASNSNWVVTGPALHSLVAKMAGPNPYQIWGLFFDIDPRLCSRAVWESAAQPAPKTCQGACRR